MFINLKLLLLFFNSDFETSFAIILVLPTSLSSVKTQIQLRAHINPVEKVWYYR